MWCETHARPSRASANVVFSSAPTASSGGAAGDRERRRARTRASGARAARRARTESSTRVWIGRSCSRKTSAMPASRSSASSSVNAIGSSDTLPLVITSGTPTSASSRWCSGEYGSITPSSRERGRDGRGDPARRATRGAMHDRPLAASAQSGARRRRGARSTSVAAIARSRAISANGRSSRCLRARSAGHRRLVVGAAREVEPADPLDRDDRAAPSSAAAAVLDRGAGVDAAARTPGRRSAGRGSGGRAGRRTRPGRPRTSRTPAIVVNGRSYGTPVTIVNRGPQSVQLMNG